MLLKKKLDLAAPHHLPCWQAEAENTLQANSSFTIFRQMWPWIFVFVLTRILYHRVFVERLANWLSHTSPLSAKHLFCKMNIQEEPLFLFAFVVTLFVDKICKHRRKAAGSSALAA